MKRLRLSSRSGSGCGVSSKMRVLGENVVSVQRGETMYMRGPVVSIDADLETLNAMVDAFLVGLSDGK